MSQQLSHNLGCSSDRLNDMQDSMQCTMCNHHNTPPNGKSGIGERMTLGLKKLFCCCFVHSEVDVIRAFSQKCQKCGFLLMSGSVSHQELKIKGRRLCQKKSIRTIQGRSFIVLVRKMDNRKYVARYTLQNGTKTNLTIDTTMSDEELKEFRREWEQLWNYVWCDESSQTFSFETIFKGLWFIFQLEINTFRWIVWRVWKKVVGMIS